MHRLTRLSATEGTSKNARAFNCVQRSHQQILETFTGYLMTALLAGLEFPLSTSFFCGLWLYSRRVWQQGYSTSDGAPGKRYDHPFAGFFWTAMLVVWMLCCLSAISVLLGRKIFWDGILSGDFVYKKSVSLN